MRPDNLEKHPEGGRFREVFRSARVVSTQEGRKRAAMTHIYFNLQRGEVSRFHKVVSDEVWNLYLGDGIRLYFWDGASDACKEVILSKNSGSFCTVVPAGVWQAAEPISGSVLVGCTVAPGFEFEDFMLMDPASKEGRCFLSLMPEMKRFVCLPETD